MIQIKQEFDTEVINELIPYFIEDSCYTKEVMADEFIKMMTSNPDSICVLVARNEGNIMAFIVAHKCYNRDYAYFAQVYSKMHHDIAQMGFAKLIRWCKKQGIKELRGEVERDSTALRGIKTYGFTEHSIVVSRKI